VKNALLTFGLLWVIIRVYQGRGNKSRPQKKLKKSKKGIDKIQTLWYNKDTERERKSRKKLQKSLKNLLTIQTEYGIIKTKIRVATYRKERN
jgi:hypothetical protein